jgi:hypothetical protein
MRNTVESIPLLRSGGLPPSKSHKRAERQQHDGMLTDELQAFPSADAVYKEYPNL